jgi:hypothetical protein
VTHYAVACFACDATCERPLHLQALEQEHAATSAALAETRSAEAAGRAAVARLQHSTARLTAQLADLTKLHDVAVLRVKEYEGGAEKRCAWPQMTTHELSIQLYMHAT